MTTITADIRKRFRSRSLKVMIAITLGYGFIYTCRLGLNIVKKPLIDNGIFTVDELGMIGAALYYGYATGKLFNGFAADHFRPRLFFSASIAISAVINLMMGWSSLLWLSLTLWALNGWFQGMAAPAAVISITNWFSIGERGRAYGIWSASHAIGEGITYYAVALVVAAWGWRFGFITPGIVCLGVATWAYAVMRDSPRSIGLPDVHEIHGDDPDPPKTQSTWATQKVVFSIKAIWVIAVASSLMYFTRYAINSWGILYLQEIRGLTLGDAGLLMGIYGGAGIAGSVAYGFISDNLFNARRPPANLIFAIVEVVSLVVIFYGPQNTTVMMIAFATYGAALSGLIASVGGLFAVDIAPRGATGAAMGLVGVFSYLGAGTQDIISSRLITDGMTVVDGVTVYNFDSAITFWIGTSVISMILAASLWNTKIRD
jgi:OPA family sugar phosphate sensor protein UhpC-like MFS transporter